MWSLPTYGIIAGTLIAWFGSVLGWSVPAFIVLNNVHKRANISD